MAFLKKICLADKLDHLKQDLILEKEEAVKIHKKKASPKFKFKHICVDIKEKLKNICCKCKCLCPESSKIYRLVYNFQHDGSCENYTIKSLLGFIGGFFLTYFLFMLFIFQLNVKISTATVMCAILGSILTIGLAFSHRIRCIVFLTLPQFFSKKGRQALLAYAFVLAITGPAKNTLNNMGILSESLACGQEQLKSAVRQIVEVIKKPFMAIRDSLKEVVKTVKTIVKKIKEIMIKIKRVIMAILRVIKACAEFLWKIVNICNKKLGTPFERCSRIFEEAITDCHAKLGPWFTWLCSVTYLVQGVCYLVKVFDYVCMVIDFISNSVIMVVVRKIKSFVRHVKTMFYVRIHFSHSFEYQVNSTKTMSQVAAGIVTEIKQRTKGVMVIFDFMSSGATLFFLFIIYKVMHYRYKFLTSERFDNIYITKDFQIIEMQRAKLGRETILPLNARERQKYIRVSSKRLVKSEKRQLSQSAVSLGTATLKLATHMMADYSLYWVLNLINYYGKFQSKVKAPNMPTVIVTGEGMLSSLIKTIVSAFQPMGIELEIDTIPCLPIPIPPDFDRYIQIATLLIICWILTLLEPYGLRFRHWIMCYYHPTRAKQRSIWLYNQILRNRSSFLKFARRQLRRKVLGDSKITKVTLKEYLLARIKILNICFGGGPKIACLLCGEVLREGDNVKIMYCSTPECPGVYCEPCFLDLKKLCTICLSPIEYGDLSDINEEIDSSDDETVVRKKILKQKIKIDHGKKYEILKSKKKEEPKDSDYYSSDNTSNYSYTYQYEKDLNTPHVETPSSHFMDIEKQDIPDFVSMESFRDQRFDEFSTKIKRKTKLKQELVDISSDTSIDDKTIILDKKSLKTKVKRKKKSVGTQISIHNRRWEDEELPLLQGSESDTTEDYHLIDTDDSEDEYCACFDNYSENFSYDYSSDSFSSIDTEIKNTYYVVPRLDLSSITKRHGYFPNVHYDVVSESSRSIPTTDDYTSAISNIFDDLPQRETDCPRSCRARNRIKPIREEMIDPKEKYDKQNKYRSKVRDYYKTTNGNLEGSNKNLKSKSRLSSFLSKVFAKSRRNTLPLYQKNDCENIELRSYNYSCNTWDTLASEINLPTYPFSLEDSDENISPQYLEENRSWERDRERGGFCAIPKISKEKQLSSDDHSNSQIGGSGDNKSKDLFKKYQITLEDLRPTKETSFSMTNNALKSDYRVHSREPAERDETLTSFSSLHNKFSPFQPMYVNQTETNANCEENGTDSTLSDTICLEILGRPCDRKKKRASKGQENSKKSIAESTVQRNKAANEKHNKLIPNPPPQLYHKNNNMRTNKPNYLNLENISSDNQQHEDETDVSINIAHDTSDKLSMGTNPSYLKVPFYMNPNSERHNCSCKCNPQTSKSSTESRNYNRDYQSMHHRSFKSRPEYREVPCDCSNCHYQKNSTHIRNSSSPKRCVCCKFATEKREPSITNHGTQTTHESTSYENECTCQNCICRSVYQSGACCKVTCCHCHSTTSIQSESDSNYSYNTNYVDLPYQEHDDYIDLVEELEEKLVCRNRNRVRKTMLEFENRSKYNKPLEKPILYNDEMSETDEPILENLSEIKKRKHKPAEKIMCCSRCCKPDSTQHRTQIYYSPERGDWYADNEKGLVKSIVRQIDPNKHQCLQRYPKISQNSNIKSRWQLNARTGEWIRVSDNEIHSRNCNHQSLRLTRYDSQESLGDYDFCGPNCGCHPRR